jgi:hypothetical protein
MEQTFPHPARQVACQEYLDAVNELEARVERLTGHIRDLVEHRRGEETAEQTRRLGEELERSGEPSETPTGRLRTDPRLQTEAAPRRPWSCGTQPAHQSWINRRSSSASSRKRLLIEDSACTANGDASPPLEETDIRDV